MVNLNIVFQQNDIGEKDSALRRELFSPEIIWYWKRPLLELLGHV